MQCHFASITPDGTRIVMAHTRGLRVWNLRLLREGLSGLGLDWAAPSYPPRETHIEPRNVQFIGSESLDPRIQEFREIVRAVMTPLIKWKRTDARDYIARGRAYDRLGLDNLAERDYNTAVRLDERLAEARLARGIAFFVARRGAKPSPT